MIKDSIIIKKSTIPNAGSGAFTTKNIKKGEFLDTYKGKWLTPEQYDNKHSHTDYIWEVLDENEENIIGYIDAGNKKYSNWTRYTNCPSTKEKWNVIAKNENKSINYYARRDIKKGEELMVWYGEEYGEKLTGKKEL